MPGRSTTGVMTDDLLWVWPGRPGIAEHYRFVEENPAVSMVFFRIRVIFRDLVAAGGACSVGETSRSHDAATPAGRGARGAGRAEK